MSWFDSVPDPKALARNLSPIEYVRRGSPPILTVHGDSDQVAPYAQAVRLHQGLDAAGVPNRLITIPGGAHGGFPTDAIREA